MRHLHTLFLSVVLFSVSTWPAVSEDTARYFTSPPTECRSGVYAGDWRLTKGEPATLAVVLKRTDRNWSSTDEMNWSLDGDVAAENAMVLADTNGRPYLQISGLDTQNPTAQRLTRNGEPDSSCAPYHLSETEPPGIRFENFEEFLKTEQPTPDDASTLVDRRHQLPPLEFLPALDRAETSDRIEAAEDDFWDRFEQTTYRRATMTDTPEGKALIPQLITFWVAGNGDLGRTNLLLDVQRQRAVALLEAETDVAENLAADSPNALCTRVDGRHRGYISWDDYLELATGLPMGFWTREQSQAFLDMSESCEDGETLRETITKRWPEIEQRTAGMNWLVSEAERYRDLEPTLEVMAAENWLAFPDYGTLREHSVSRETANTILAPILEEERSSAVTPLAEELIARLPDDADLSTNISFCRNQRSELDAPYRNDLFARVIEECESHAAELLQARGEELISARLEELDAAPRNLEGLKETDGFDLNIELGQLYARGNFETTITHLQELAEDAQAQADDMRQEAVDAAQEEMEAFFAAADPAVTDVSDLPRCDDLPIFSDWAADLRNSCRAKSTNFHAQRETLLCDRIWEDLDAPEALEEGTVEIATPLGGKQSIPMRELVCEGKDAGITLQRNRGWFSSEYRLVHADQSAETEITFSARLAESENERHWTLVDAQMEPSDALSPEVNLGQPVDIWACLRSPQACQKR